MGEGIAIVICPESAIIYGLEGTLFSLPARGDSARISGKRRKGERRTLRRQETKWDKVGWRKDRPKDRQIGKVRLGWTRKGRDGEEYKQFDVTSCIRLVAPLIAQEAHFYPSSDVLRRSPPSADHAQDHYLRKSYLPATPNGSRNISDGIAAPKVGRYIQSRPISGSLFFTTDLCFPTTSGSTVNSQRADFRMLKNLFREYTSNDGPIVNDSQ